MSNVENARTRTDAIQEAKVRRTSGASRNRFWAGLNRYLETEAEHEHKALRSRSRSSRGSRNEPPADCRGFVKYVLLGVVDAHHDRPLLTVSADR